MANTIKSLALKIINNWWVVGILCLTVGIAPFPLESEPHILGKIRWILGGAKDMGWIDWLDFVVHSIPWILLIRLLNKKLSA